MYIADEYNYCVRKITPAGGVSTFAGIGGVSGYSGDGGPATAAKILYAVNFCFDSVGNMFLADGSSRVRKIDTFGVITTFCGTGVSGYSGDGGYATAANLYTCNVVATDRRGNVYVSEYSNNCIRKVNTSGVISTFFGTGFAGFSGDGGPATAAQLSGPTGLVIDSIGNMYVVDARNNRIRKVDTLGIVSTYAGNGGSGFSGDGGMATAAQIGNAAQNCSFDRTGNLYFSDGTNMVIRRISLSGLITTVAGTAGVAGYSGDGGPATACKLNSPGHISFDARGDGYIADYNNNVIRKVWLASTPPEHSGLTDQQTYAKVDLVPNPAHEYFDISIGDVYCVQGTVKIFSLTGALVSKVSFVGDLVRISVKDYPAGMYICDIDADGRRLVKRVVVE